ncbi:hypothetical protein AA313_de0203426 [Arthrobotrys entomopaga]|nr:hypothetical protein AA313_de0203426 [Arthrobotrys entomopaga]
MAYTGLPKIAILILATFIPSVASQLAVFRPTNSFIENRDPAANTSYSLLGTLTSFDPPAGCNTAILKSTDRNTRNPLPYAVVYAFYSVGCFTSGPSSCCPPNWAEAGYFISNVASCPPGYSKVSGTATIPVQSQESQVIPIYYLSSGTQTVWPCCPTIDFSYSKGSTSGVLRAAEIGLQPSYISAESSTGEQYTALCFYDEPTVIQNYTESGTPTLVKNYFYGNPLYIFQDETESKTIPQSNNGAPTTMATSLSGTSTARPGSTAISGSEPSQTGENPGSATGGGRKEGSGLSTGAAAGIGVGVGVPVVLAAIFLAYYCLTRRNSKSPKEPEAAPEPSAANKPCTDHEVGVGLNSLSLQRPVDSDITDIVSRTQSVRTLTDQYTSKEYIHHQ